MKSRKSVCLFLVLFACFLYLSHGYNRFYVGGKDGWVLQPKEKYNDWAGRHRFQVNDTLIFKYEKGSDSVLLVDEDDYYKCHRKSPIKKMANGSSEFQFPRSGPFFFISGKDGHCQKGQKLITVVMAVRKGTPSTHPPKAIPPAKSPFPSPGPAHSPKYHGPVAKPPTTSTPGPALPPGYLSPVAQPPTESSPSPASSSGPTLSPTPHGPVANSPQVTSTTPAPAPSTYHSPRSGPSHSPMSPGPIASPPKSTSPSPATSPVSSPPAPPQGPSPSPSGSQVPSGRQTGTPPGEPSPPPLPSKTSATATYSSVMVLAASVLFSMILGNFVVGF